MTTIAPPPHPGWNTERPETVQVRAEAAGFGAVLTRIRTSRPSISSRTNALPCLSQTALAAIAGLTHGAIYRLETGDRTPKAATVRALAEALGATPEERKQLFESAGFVDTEAGR